MQMQMPGYDDSGHCVTTFTNAGGATSQGSTMYLFEGRERALFIRVHRPHQEARSGQEHGGARLRRNGW